MATSSFHIRMKIMYLLGIGPAFHLWKYATHKSGLLNLIQASKLRRSFRCPLKFEGEVARDQTMFHSERVKSIPQRSLPQLEYLANKSK